MFSAVLKDAYACGKAESAFQVIHMRRSGSRCEPCKGNPNLKCNEDKGMKKKSVTALVLAFLMCFTTVSPALAAENVTVEMEESEKSAEEVSEESIEQEKAESAVVPEEAESAVVPEEAENPVEEEQSPETEEKEERSEAGDVSGSESTQQIQIEETVDEAMNEAVTPQETELTQGASAAAAEEAATSSQEKTEEENTDTVTMSGETGTVIVEGSDDADSDELFSEYVDIEFGISAESAGEKNKKTTGTRLTGNNLTIYNKIAAALPAIAAGEQSSTVFEFSAEDLGVQGTWTAEELGLESLVVNGSITDEASEALFEKIAFSAETVVRALLSDYPYELYWYDKTVGANYKTPGLSGNSKKLSYSENITVSFAVAEEYAYESELYVTDTSIGQSVQTAVANADAIVSNYSDKSVTEMLSGYNSEICELVDYNRSAAAGGISYGNPWQLIWVFDGDDSTKVVCEGYSKAFKYLCDKSDIDCILVTGTMNGGTGAGAHMWNIVSMDGTNYLVDITNCDSGTIGEPDLLFLKKTDDLTIEEEVETGYTFTLTTGTIVYAYDTTTLNYYTQDELSLAGEAEEHVHTMKNVPAKAATCTEAGNYEYWKCRGCGKVFSDKDGNTETSLEDVTIAATGHSLTPVEAKAATCTEAGNKAYWKCSECDALFGDAEGKTETSLEEVTIAATGHSLTPVEAKAKTTTAAENYAHSQCSERPALFSDAEGKTETSLEEVTIAATGHSLTPVEAKAATCTEAGNKAYWKCSECDALFSDAEGKTETSLEEVTIAATGHSLTPVEAKAATCTEAGNKAYWKCSGCDELFSDAEGKTETNQE